MQGQREMTILLDHCGRSHTASFHQTTNPPLDSFDAAPFRLLNEQAQLDNYTMDLLVISLDAKTLTARGWMDGCTDGFGLSSIAR